MTHRRSKLALISSMMTDRDVFSVAAAKYDIVKLNEGRIRVGLDKRKMAENIEQPIDKISKGMALLSVFECGACKKNLRPPIRMCKYGHNFCDICKKDSKCAVCRVTIKREVRNVGLENIAVVRQNENIIISDFVF